ncbi:MAG: phosphodiesterase [Spirochaetaceae bacterium]
MRFLVISDIHGSITAFKKVLAIFNGGDFDKLLICGDLLYHGARNPLPEGYDPKNLSDLLNSVKESLIVVKGNCESEVDSMVLEFPISGDYSHIITPSLDVFLSHGHIYSPENLPALKANTVFISGHTHIPTADKIGDTYCFNPGSISLPKGGFGPSYGLLTENIWEVRDLNENFVIKSCNL